MKKTLLLITSVLFITSAAFSQSKMDINNLIDRGGLLYAPNNDKPFSGSVFEFYENGTEKLNGKYRKGIKNGKWEWWSATGIKDSLGTYKNGIKHGKWTFWYDSGVLLGEQKWKNGMADGLFAKWYENGAKESEETYKNGKEDGLWTYWYENGEKWKEGPYKDGKSDGLWTYWDNDGSKYEGKVIRKDDEDGTFLYWYDNEKTKIESHKSFKDGKEEGLWTEWHENGQKKSEGTYKDGKEDGFWTGWYENGKKKREGTYKDGKQDGLWTGWYEDGREIIPIIPEFVAVEGGTFQMGSNNGYFAQLHSVTVSDFNISKTEVTFEQYDAFCGATGRNKPSDYGWGRGDLPVIDVSWRDAVAYCEWMNKVTGKTYRLPTEAEWEYAARGGNKSKGYKYSGSNTISSVGWYDNNSGNKTHPVAQKQPNELGLYDMSGNVGEWCSDWQEDYSSSPQTDPQGPNSGTSRVRRGGGWLSPYYFCRVANRSGYYPDYRYNNYGFRLVLSQD